MKLAAQNYRHLKNIKMFFHEKHSKLEMKRTKERKKPKSIKV